MQPLTTLLQEAEQEWRHHVSRDYPLWSTIPVERTGKPHPGRDWHFSTDLKKIMALVFNDESLQRKFKDVVPKYWDGEPEELARETVRYLLFHELYHPLEAPSSKDDNKKIHQAIRRGLLKTEPKLSPLEQVGKVSAVENAVKDFILDNRFAVENEERNYVRQDVIPIWDLLELQDTPTKTNFYTITRYLYGQLYGPEKVHEFFEGKAEKKGVAAAQKAINALIQKAEDTSLVERLKKLVSGKRKNSDDVVQAVRSVFAGEDRYTGIERFIAVLAPYIQPGMPNARCGYHGEGSGSSPQNILQDLLDDMTPQEQQEFLSSIPEDIEKPTTFSAVGSGHGTNFTNDEINTLEISAIHELYKRNHPKVNITSGVKQGETVIVGKKERFVLQKTSVVTEERLLRMNLSRLARFQQRTRLPVLIPLENGLYRINEYRIDEREIRDVVYVDTKLDVPEEVEFYVDSSGSMYTNAENLGLNDGSSWDMLSSVLYGYVDALYQASQELQKPCSLRFHNFADTQKSSRRVSVDEFWEQGPAEVLKPLFKPENGYSVEELDIKVQKDGKQRAYVVVTDGNLVIDGRTQRESAKMKQLAKQPGTNVILFEIGGNYSLGKVVSGDKNIHYYPVYDKHKMLQQGIEVLLAK